jgi:hypothetical protein
MLSYQYSGDHFGTFNKKTDSMHQDANDPNSGDAYELNSIEHRKSNGAERYAEARASMD